MAKYRYKKTLHHLCPVSRGGFRGDNRVEINEVLHYAWHFMNDDHLPEEVLQNFLDVWWPNDGYQIIVDYGRASKIFTFASQRVPWCYKAPYGYEVVFPNCRPLEMLKIWYWRWVPPEYFDAIHIEGPGIAETITYDVQDSDTLSRHDAIQRRVLDAAYRRWNATGRWWSKETTYSIRV